jgi:hypothetical protein
MATEEEIAQVLTLLEPTFSDSEQPPAVVIQPPDSGEFILGNRNGFVCLATLCLKAAIGQIQSFENEPWIVAVEHDWEIKGLMPDENAQTYLPIKPTRFQKIRGSVILYSILFFIAFCIVVGFITIVRWIVHSI